MIRNLPLLLSMMILGNGAAILVNLMPQLPEILFWPLLIVSLILNIWGLIGLVLHMWVRRVENGHER